MASCDRRRLSGERVGWQDVAAGSHVCQPKPVSVGLGLRPRYYLLVGALSPSAEALLLAGESEHD